MADSSTGEYPSHWEAEVVLRDGGTAVIRPIRPDDRELLLEFYDRVSDQSKYLRFFAPYPRLSQRDVDRFTRVDHTDRVALIVTVAESMIAVGRYDRTGTRTAEVAFLVEDAHQGRGVASVLLEHLAQAARENGITRFEAEVLPENRRMAGVFEEAGYRRTTHLDEGVVQLQLEIEPTTTSLDVMQAREHRSEARSVERLLRPRGIAVAGAETELGGRVLANLQRASFDGPIVTDIAQAGRDEIDLVVAAGEPEAMSDVVLDAAVKGARGLLVVSGGFAETGEEGRRRQRRLVRMARSYGLRVVGPSALGIINTHKGLNASLSSVVPTAGNVGFFCQSGALGTVVLRTVAERGIGLSTFVSAGNRADVSGNDVLQFWEEDPETDVVLLYLESIGNPRKFSRIARRVSEVKPVVAIRAGRFTQGVPLGHTVHVPGVPREAVDAMFRQAGVIVVDTLDAMLDLASLLATQPLPAGERVGIAGAGSGGDPLGLLVADAAGEHGLTVTDVSEADGVVLLGAEVPPDANVERPAVAIGEVEVPDVPSYSSPEAAIAALAQAAAYARWRRTPRGEVPRRPDLDLARARELVENGRTDGVLACYGLEPQDGGGSGVPLVVEGIEDPGFGPVLSFGVAGIAVELFDDVSYRIPPLTDVDAAEMVREIRAAPLLYGRLGGERADVAAIEDLLLRVSDLLYDLPEVARVSLRASADASGVTVLEASLELGRADSRVRPDRYTRRLTRL